MCGARASRRSSPRSGEARQRQGHLGLGQVDVRGRARATAGRAVRRARCPPPRAELERADGRGFPGARARGDGRRARRLGDRRQLRGEAGRHRARPGGHDRLARPPTRAETAAALAAHAPSDPTRRRALERQQGALADRSLGLGVAVRVDAARALPAPAAVAATVRGRPALRPTALGCGGEGMARERFDVLILGGGAAGCALAGRLSENPDRTVCLVEAGPDYGHLSEGRWPADILDPRWLALESHLWERADEEDRSQARARVLGGRSVHNACVILEGAPADYEWGAGWSYESFAPYLKRAAETLQTHVLPDDELTPWHRAFRQAGGDDSIVHPVNIVDGVRWHSGFAYVDPARGRGNLTILADTLVDRVLLEDGRAVGALADGRELQAAVVVVSASAYGSPAILLRSGIGPEGDVAQLPVGEGLVDH